MNICPRSTTDMKMPYKRELLSIPEQMWYMLPVGGRAVVSYRYTIIATKVERYPCRVSHTKPNI
jgi:hypothetical protein